MQETQILIKPACRARGGIHPPHNKKSANCPAQKIPLAQEIFIPMRQHIGVPCTPLVKAGDTVTVGQKIGEASADFSAPIHASVSGTVKEVKPLPCYNGQLTETVVITPDGAQTECPDLKPVTVNTPKELIAAAKECGLVGLGGAGFPTHIKLTPNENTPIDTLLINAAECEPHITSDYRACLEDGDLILQGIQTLLRVLKVEKVIIGIEDNKPRAIENLVSLIDKSKETRIFVMKLPSHYPHGAEKILVQVATGRRVPMGKLPAHVGCAVMNITSVAVLQHYINTGMPLTRRRITVDGPAVKDPVNLWIPVGTPISHVMEHINLKAQPTKILMGGPMMGVAQVNLHTPVVKQNNAILFFDKKHDLTDKKQGPCIRCGRCASACPMSLMPTLIERFAKINDVENLRRVGVGVCMECGSCAYSCPANRPLVQYMRLAKEIERKERG